jgi:hypothetical protein
MSLRNVSYTLYYYCTISDSGCSASESHSPLAITIVLSVLSASEAKKPASKREPKTQSAQFSTDEPWDTLKAQVLAKISTALNPPSINFAHYDIMFYIPRVLPKPGLPLMSQEDFNIMHDRACNLKTKNPTINVTVVEKRNSSEKENIDDEVEEDEQKTKKGKKVRPQIISGYSAPTYIRIRNE